jgi:hypothetical protein
MTKEPGPVRKLFQDVMGRAAKQGWMIGLLDGADASIEAVLNDAKRNLARVPNDAVSASAVSHLTAALNHVREVSTKLETIATGEG